MDPTSYVHCPTKTDFFDEIGPLSKEQLFHKYDTFILMHIEAIIPNNVLLSG